MRKKLEELWYRFKFYLMKFAYLQKRNRLRRYGFTVALSLLATPLFIFIPEIYFRLINSQVVSLLSFFLVVAASAWYGGLGPGILATVLIGTINYFTLLRADLPLHPPIGDILITFIYMSMGFLISLISEARYEAELQKDQFISLAAHEIKNPLTTIKGYAILLQKKLKKIPAKKFLEYINEVSIQADILLELTDSLLDVSKIEIGKFDYEEELFDFDNLVRRIVKNQQVVNKNRNIMLSGTAHKIIKADSYRLGQVITNMLTNAVKYSPQKRPIRLRIRGSKDGVVLTVRDYGIGIPTAEQKNIFKLLYRSKGFKPRSINGLGLGLYISSQIVKHHRGKLEVKSKKGSGSVFTLEIPKNY